jgi:LysR family transcriptional regulator, glycine cleavage system transcriptional activator
MRRKIPSTGALLAFEAAGRHESFSRAAEELGITEGAVSRQIARLEDFLELMLFNRVKGRIHLTDAGREYWTNIADNLEQIERNTLNFQARPSKGGVLELAVIPTFTNRWLIPRLPQFYASHPNIIINMSERPEPFLFAGSAFDAAIHYDHPAWAGMIKKDLFAEELVPVCSPSLIGGRRELSLAEMKDLPLLHKRGRPDAWKKWWAHFGDVDINPVMGARYDLFSMTIEAAAAGLGVALVPRLYVVKEVEEGRLVLPFDRHVPGDKHYCIVCPEWKHGSWPLRPFLDWLMQEADLYVRQRENINVFRESEPIT